jgi:hypothetical protein
MADTVAPGSDTGRCRGARSRATLARPLVVPAALTGFLPGSG